MRRRAAALAIAVIGLPATVGATEFTDTHVDLGYVDTLAGVTPAPGLYLRDDTNIIVSGRLNDQTGNQASLNLAAVGGGKVPLRFRNTVAADIVFAAYVPDWKVPVLNATIGIAVDETFGNSRAGLTSAVGIPQAHASSKAGLGDVTIVPIFLAVSIPRASVSLIFAPFDVTLPTGTYSKTDPIGNNFGLNYFSYRPALEFTYLNKTGQEVSLNINGSINAQNQATGYKSGNEFSVTYAFQQHVNQNLAFGIGGYYYRQISDDTIHGKPTGSNPLLDPLNLGLGSKGETFAYGPIVSYQITGSAILQAHWDHEAFSYDRPQRDQIYARATLCF